MIDLSLHYEMPFPAMFAAVYLPEIFGVDVSEHEERLKFLGKVLGVTLFRGAGIGAIWEGCNTVGKT